MATSEPRFVGMNRNDLIAEIERLEMHLAVKDKQIKWMEEQANEEKIKNKRNAGRKPKLTREMQAEIKRLLDGGCGYSYRQVAERMKISVGLVGKAYNMSEEDALRLPGEPKETTVQILIDGQMSLEEKTEKCSRCGTPNAGYVDGYFKCVECDFGNYDIDEIDEPE